MNKKKFIIILIIMVLACGGLIAYVAVNGAKTKQEVEVRGDEYIEYSKTFNIIDSADKTYYMIGDLTEDAQSLETVAFPNTIDGLPVKQWVVNNNGSAYKNVTTIIIPANMEYIGKDKTKTSTYGDSFLTSSFSELVSFTVDADNPTYASRDGILYSKDLTVLLRYPNQKGSDVQLKVEILAGTKEIYEDAFYYNAYLHQITFNDELETIGEKAFWHCDNLAVVKFNENLVSIGVRAFGYTGISSVVFPASLQEIKTNAFSSCSKLAYVEIYENTKTIGNNAFTANADELLIYTPADNVEWLKTVIQESNSGKQIHICPLNEN